MVIELVAGRCIARYFGVSIHTWTAVIGIVLAGIASGNFIGGRLADRYPPRPIIALIFIISSALCAAMPVMQNLISDWELLLALSLPLHIVLHVLFVFFLPSAFLGMLGPIAAKMAVEIKQKTGYALGSIYAWSALGSIAGTFAAGYYLIAALGTSGIIWVLSGVMALMGIFYGLKSRGAMIWPFILLILFVLGNSSWKWAQAGGEALALREPVDPNIIYIDESRHTYIKIHKDPLAPGFIKFNEDNLIHSIMDTNNPLELQYSYLKIFAIITEKTHSRKKNLSFLEIGGGGYCFPRYLEATYHRSDIEVVEIDPAVTKAAMNAFGLSKETGIKIHHIDGRIFINRLASKKRRGTAAPSYDFIYTDAYYSYIVPWHLTTLEFNENIREILSPNGIYMIDIVDILEKANFLSPMINTMEKVFPYVYVLTEKQQTVLKYSTHQPIVLVGARKECNLSD